VASDGYSYANSTFCASLAPMRPSYNWVTETSNEINWGTNGDDSVLNNPISIPFPFKFFGINYNQFWIGSNGWISFSNPTALSAAVQRTPVNMPAAGGIENYIAAAFADLDLTTATYADAHTYYGGDATQFVITFLHAHLFNSPTNFISFQIILKLNGDIIVQYNDLESSIPVSTSITNFCSVGIENTDGTKGILYRLNGSGGPMFGSPLALQFYIRPAAVVPVTLLNFTAGRVNYSNRLYWSTSQEANSRNFVIERSSNSSNFTAIGEVAANTSSNTVINYSFTDNSPLKGINYYRLKMNDAGNISRYSAIKSVSNTASGVISIYPNPVKDNMSIALNAEKGGKGTLTITDLSGKTVLSTTVLLNQGNNNVPVSVSALAKGSYFLKLLLHGNTVSGKFNKL
jgi:hypothetical protein